MQVHDAKPGQIIETLDMYGFPTGNVYKVAEHSEIIGKVTCWTRFTNIKVQVHPTNHCRLLDLNFLDGGF